MADVKVQSDASVSVDNPQQLIVEEEVEVVDNQLKSSPPQQPQWMAMRYPPAVVMPHQMMYVPAPPPPPYSPYHQYHHHQSRGNKYHNASNGENKTIWIGDLHHWMDESYLSSSFASAGEMVSVKVIRNKHTGVSKGYGFVEFLSHIVADKVLQEFNGATSRVQNNLSV